MKLYPLILSFMIFTSSCASMFNGTTEKIHIRSDNPSTKLYMDNKEVGTGTATVTVAKKNMHDVRFSAKRPGCSDASTEIETKFNPNTLWGILIDLGLVSILLIDWAANGSTSEAARRDYVLNPTCEIAKTTSLN